MISANGSLDFLSSELVVGTAFRVDRTYLGGQLASGDGVTLDCLLSACRATNTKFAYLR